MPRSYAYSFLLALQKADPNSLGVKLARICVDANLPALYVSKVLMISRNTIYIWFRGNGIREKYRPRVEVFIDLVDKDIKAGLLPVNNIIDAKFYLNTLSGGLV